MENHWNHRVVRSRHDLVTVNDTELFEYQYDIREVFYNAKGEICGMTQNAIWPSGETVEELTETLQRMLRACEQDVLIEEEVVYGDWGETEEPD